MGIQSGAELNRQSIRQPLGARLEQASVSRSYLSRGLHHASSRRFACDPVAHQVCVVDADGRLLEAFGEPGSLPGQFLEPADAVVVSPRFHGEDASDRPELVAVADRGNRRVQVFEPHGQLVAILGNETPATPDIDRGRAGWPFFRLGSTSLAGDPVSLDWQDPYLVVTDSTGCRTSIDLAAALLPSFDDWLDAATVPMLSAAHHHFRHKVRGDDLAAPLAAIETALGRYWLETGEPENAARLWSLSWPSALDARQREGHARERDRAATAAAFRLGGAARTTRVRTAIRQSLGAFAVLPHFEAGPGGRETREAC
jgi:hypothetical protein